MSRIVGQLEACRAWERLWNRLVDMETNALMIRQEFVGRSFRRDVYLVERSARVLGRYLGMIS